MRRYWDKAMFAFAVLLLTFAYGFVTGEYEIFPYATIESAKMAARDLRVQWKSYFKIEPVGFLKKARYDGDGVVVYDVRKAQPGVTFMTGFFDGVVALQVVDMEGNIVKRWPVPFSEVWPNPDHLEGVEIPPNDWLTDIHGARLLDDGSVMFNIEYIGLVKMDNCGKVVWRLPYMTHHSVFRAEDGTFWVAGRRYHETPSKNLRNIEAPFWEDTIVQVSEDGEILKEISLLELFYSNKMEGLLFVTGDRNTKITVDDPVHLNDVEVLSSDLADEFPMFDAGDVMVSMRHNNLVMVFDPETNKIKWHQVGPWLRQHDPDFLPDGRISIFDNRGAFDDDDDVFGGSRILTVDPATGVVDESFVGTGQSRFFTRSRGKHQNLANGNILITESWGGRAFEVDRDGQVVWSFVNRYDEDRVGIIQQADRLPDGQALREALSCD